MYPLQISPQGDETVVGVCQYVNADHVLHNSIAKLHDCMIANKGQHDTNLSVF